MNQSAILLIVDDQEEMRDLLAELLRPLNCTLLFASNGADALTQAQTYQPDMMLLDVMMPGMDGFEVCRRLRAEVATRELPIVMVTALEDQDSRLTGIDAGADDFISKPFNRAELRARVRTILRLNRYRRLRDERDRFERLFVRSPEGIAVVDTNGQVKLANPAMLAIIGHSDQVSLVGHQLREFVIPTQQDSFDALLKAVQIGLAYAERRESAFIRIDGSTVPVELTIGTCSWDDQPTAQVIVRDISERKQAEATIQALHSDLLGAYDATLEGWSRTLDLRDHETEGHSQRVTDLTIQLARALKISGDDLTNIRRGALLHDIGKMGIPDGILRKPGPLDSEEWRIMRLHPVYAYDLLRSIRFLQPALDIPYSHHERWNGSGYPLGLKGAEIPLAARIFAIVDVWDAMTNDRPYRAALPFEEVRDYMRTRSGIDFDPAMLEVFLEMVTKEMIQPGIVLEEHKT